VLPQRINGDACGLSRRWILSPILAEGLVQLQRRAQERFASTPFDWPGLWIIGGHRTFARQASLNPAVEDSLHTRCPSLAADLRVGTIAGLPRTFLLDLAGEIWMTMGFRWGGTFSDFPNPAHFDIGRI